MGIATCCDGHGDDPSFGDSPPTNIAVLNFATNVWAEQGMRVVVVIVWSPPSRAFLEDLAAEKLLALAFTRVFIMTPKLPVHIPSAMLASSSYYFTTRDSASLSGSLYRSFCLGCALGLGWAGFG